MNTTCSKAFWPADDRGQMTETAIRELHGAPRKARVSRYIYDPNEEIDGTSRKCTGYVLDGRFELYCAGGVTALEAGDVFLFSGGDYKIRTGDSNGAIVVWAWDFPPGFAAPQG